MKWNRYMHVKKHSTGEKTKFSISKSFLQIMCIYLVFLILLTFFYWVAVRFCKYMWGQLIVGILYEMWFWNGWYPPTNRTIIQNWKYSKSKENTYNTLQEEFDHHNGEEVVNLTKWFGRIHHIHVSCVFGEYLVHLCLTLWNNIAWCLYTIFKLSKKIMHMCLFGLYM